LRAAGNGLEVKNAHQRIGEVKKNGMPAATVPPDIVRPVMGLNQ